MGPCGYHTRLFIKRLGYLFRSHGLVSLLCTLSVLPGHRSHHLFRATVKVVISPEDRHCVGESQG